MHQDVFEELLNRPIDSHKYQFGHVLVIGGSPGMVGAPLLVAEAALRTGAGLVTIASQKDVVDKLERRIKEVMTLALPNDTSQAIEVVESFIQERKVSVVVVGPGMKAQTDTFVTRLIENVDLPVVIDGGALGALRQHLDSLRSGPSKYKILTPHLGEFQRFYDQQLPQERPRLKPVAQKFAKKYSVMLVLKGSPTYVAHPDGRVYENATGNPGLATAGTGDVLAGIIAGIVAQGIAPNKAAEAGVYLHGLAGDLAAKEKTQPGMIASDVISSIPAALKSFLV